MQSGAGRNGLLQEAHPRERGGGSDPGTLMRGGFAARGVSAGEER